MTTALFEDFARLEQGQGLTLYNQELNPLDRSKVLILEIAWRHDRIVGDLVFGAMDIPGVGSLEVDAFIYRNSVLERPGVEDSVWLSPVNTRKTLSASHNLTGGPLRKTKPLPSEIYVPADGRRDSADTEYPPELPFSRDEHNAILRWQTGIEQKGFDSDFPRESYAEYKRANWHSLSSTVSQGGLQSGIEISRVRKGLFSSIYSIYATDSSFRSSRWNPGITNARPGNTSFLQENCSSFQELPGLMDHAVDILVQRNELHTR